MKILIHIPMDDYNNFVQRCDASRPEYETLKNGVINRDGNERVAVEILCAVEDAKMLLQLAAQIYPLAAPHVEESISLARQPQSLERHA
jgi:hypothetical protein